jgi:hypothetical protein
MGSMELLAQLVGCAAAGLVPGLSLAMALRRALHHHRASRVARFARDPSAAIREGFALLHGTVIDDDDAPPGPVLLLNMPAESPSWRPEWRTPPRSEARPFSLRLASGAVVRVEPEAGRWTIDIVFVPVLAGDEPRYEAAVHADSEVYVAGQMRREIDPRATGKGYRDAAQAWILRAPARSDLAFSAAPVVTQHARRARFHAAWSLALAALTTWSVIHFLAGAHVSDSATIAALAITMVAGIVALAIYEFTVESTEPWVVRRPPQ